MNKQIFIATKKNKPYNMGRGSYKRLINKMLCAYQNKPWHWYQLHLAIARRYLSPYNKSHTIARCRSTNNNQKPPANLFLKGAFYGGLSAIVLNVVLGFC